MVPVLVEQFDKEGREINKKCSKCGSEIVRQLNQKQRKEAHGPFYECSRCGHQHWG